MSAVTIELIKPTRISEIARAVFGNRTEVSAIEEIRPVAENGAWRITGCTWNLSYIVAIRGDRQRYVFRFNRRRYERGDETIEKEIRHYDLIGRRTAIPTPRIHHVDLSHAMVPTGYMVMDWMEGDHYAYLTHPDNPTTSAEEKREIFHAAGQAVSEIHEITRPPGTATSGTDRVLSALDSLERVIGDHSCRVSREQIERCRDVLRGETDLNINPESLRLGDADLNFAKIDGRWRVSFICDLEWLDYGDPYFDFANVLCAPDPIWSLSRPLSGESVRGMTAHPFFVGYEEKRPVDFRRLSRMATYAHLCVMCSIARGAYRPDEEGDIAEREPPIYYELLQAVERNSGVVTRMNGGTTDSD